MDMLLSEFITKACNIIFKSKKDHKRPLPQQILFPKICVNLHIGLDYNFDDIELCIESAGCCCDELQKLIDEINCKELKDIVSKSCLKFKIKNID
jgi:hypothetical protein